MWRRKSKQEIADIEKNTGDATGAYEFLPWIIYMRFMYLFGFLFNLGVGIFGIFTACKTEGDILSWFVGIFFSIVSMVIVIMLRKEYKNLQRGISS